MEQKSIIQLVALGTFSFALGIITTLTIQSIVGSTLVQTSSSSRSESTVISSQSSSVSSLSEEQTHVRFDIDYARLDASHHALSEAYQLSLENVFLI
jgi:hypothetical protein